MKFEFYNPVHFVFGNDALEIIAEICAGHKVLLVYGGGSVRKNGMYDRITGILREQGIPWLDYGNQTTTTWQGVLDGIALAKAHEIDCIIEVGGASAMDTGKAIAFGALHDHLEDYILRKKVSDNRHLLNIVIPTYPSTGSEADGVCDIMEYNGYGVELFGAWADYCLMVPEATYSLDRAGTAYSVLVCFIQTASYYLGIRGNDIASGFAKTVLKVLLDSYQKVLANPQDEQARSNILWASSVDTMGIFRSDVETFYPWTLYSLGYVPRVIHGVSYREALTVAYPRWLKGVSKYHMEDIRRLLTEIFELDSALSNDELVERGCACWLDLMRQGGIPLNLSARGACPNRETVIQSLAPEDFGEFQVEEMCDMLENCYEEEIR